MENDTVSVSVKQQEQRTFLRERFLRMLGALSGEKMDVKMHEVRVSGTFMAADVEFNNVQVRQLATPMGMLPYAQLRSLDIISVKFPHLSQTAANP